MVDGRETPRGRRGWDQGPGLQGGAGAGNWLPLGPAGESKRRHAQDARAFAHSVKALGMQAAPPGEALGPGQRAGQWDLGGGR